MIIGQQFQKSGDIIDAIWGRKSHFKSKSHLIIGQKSQKMLDIIGSIWDKKWLFFVDTAHEKIKKSGNFRGLHTRI